VWIIYTAGFVTEVTFFYYFFLIFIFCSLYHLQNFSETLNIYNKTLFVRKHEKIVQALFLREYLRSERLDKVMLEKIFLGIKC